MLYFQICKVPKLTLANDANKFAYHRMPKLNCSGGHELLFYLQNKILRLNKTTLKDRPLERCEYRAIQWMTDFYHSYTDSLFKEVAPWEIKVHHDFVHVTCYLKKDEKNKHEQGKNQQALGGQGKNQQALDGQEEHQHPLGGQGENQHALGGQGENQQAQDGQGENQHALGGQSENQHALGGQSENQHAQGGEGENQQVQNSQNMRRLTGYDEKERNVRDANGINAFGGHTNKDLQNSGGQLRMLGSMGLPDPPVWKKQKLLPVASNDGGNNAYFDRAVNTKLKKTQENGEPGYQVSMAKHTGEYVQGQQQYWGQLDELGKEGKEVKESDHELDNQLGEQHDLYQSYNNLDLGMDYVENMPDFDQILIQVEEKPEVAERLRDIEPHKDCSGISVLMFALDSMSHLSYQRKLPHTYKYLKDILGATVLHSYNIVGDATTAAIIPIMTGKALAQNVTTSHIILC